VSDIPPGETAGIIPEFSHSLNTIVFNFSALHFGSQDNLYYQFFLKGFDENWSDWQKANQVEYSDLSGGNYLFQIKAKNIFDNVSDIISYQFLIRTPIYKAWWAFLIYLFIGTALTFLLIRWRSYYFVQNNLKLENLVSDRTADLVKAKEESEKLLANVLPKATADEIKSKGRASSQKFKMVTVLFSDIQGFTKIAEHTDPETLIDMLDTFYFEFDSVVEKYNIEKIKTIGDAYMCAGGIPNKNRTNPVESVLAALEMQQYMKNLQIESKAKNKNIWDLRIGIHTGPVIAGVVGHKKLSYDIWGDSVNIASRMESSGEIGKVNISGSTYELVRDYFICEYRGKMPVKYKGEIDMYFVKGFRPELSVDLRGVPNKKFQVQLQLLRLMDFEEMVIEKMETEVSEDIYFHDLKHTINVYTQVELIGRAENVSEENMLLLRTAGLVHDLGFLKDYDKHEEAGCELSREILPDYQYTDDQINVICDLILSTKIPPSPKNQLEKIICDANLDYLGRVDYLTHSENLYKELEKHQKIKSKEEWYNEQIDFITNHEFFTTTAKMLRDVDKETQIENIRKSLKNL